MSPFVSSWRIGVDCDEAIFNKQLDLLMSRPGVIDEMALCLSNTDSFAYMPLPDFKKQIDLFPPRAARLRALGIRVGMNLWPSFGSIGHERGPGRMVNPFRPMVGMDGREEYGLACPTSAEFLDYMYQKLALCAKAGPSFIWIDDDMRFTHLAGTPEHGAPYPCFCDECVKGFMNGQFGSRQALVDALNADADGSLRRAWCAYGADRIALYCRTLRAAVDSVDPSIDLPLMTVGETHSTYSGDYIEKAMSALRSRGARPGHGFFNDDTPRRIFRKTMDVSRQIARYPASCRDNIQFEEESHPRTRLGKAFLTRLTEVALSLAAGCTGVAYNHMPWDGPAEPYTQLTREMEMIGKARPLFEEMVSFSSSLPPRGFQPVSHPFLMAGMKGPWFDERRPGYDLSRTDEWLTYGVAMTANHASACGALLHSRIAETLSDDELISILHRPVFLDGEALLELEKRGLGQYTGVRSGRKAASGTERLTSDPMNGPYAQGHRGAFSGSECDIVPMEAIELIPLSPDVRVLSQALCGREGMTLNCVTYCVNSFGAPVCVMSFEPWYSLGTPGKMFQLRSLLAHMQAPVRLEPVLPYDISRTAPFLRSDGRRHMLLLTNAWLDRAEAFDAVIQGAASSAWCMDLTGRRASLPVQQNDGHFRLHIPHMDPWQTLVLFAQT